MPLRSLVSGLGLLPLQRFAQHALQIFVEVAFQVQGVISDFHFQAVQGTLFGQNKEPCSCKM